MCLCKACGQALDGAFYLTTLIIPVSEWTLNLVGLPCVNKAGLVIYFIDVFNWIANAVITNIQVDFPEGDTVSGFIAS